MTDVNTELAARQQRMDAATLRPAISAGRPVLAIVPPPPTQPDIKRFSGNYLLFRKDGRGVRKMKGAGARPPKFRHPDRDSAEAEAARLLALYPASTFIVLQEVGRVKLKAADCADG